MHILNKEEINELKKKYKEEIKFNIQKNLIEQIINYIEIKYKFYFNKNKLYFGKEDLEKEIIKFKNTNLDNIELLKKFDLYKISLIDEKFYISNFTLKLYKIEHQVKTRILSEQNSTLLLENGKIYTLSPKRKFLLNKPSVLYKEFIYKFNKDFVIDLIKNFYLKNCFSDKLIKDLDI